MCVWCVRVMRSPMFAPWKCADGRHGTCWRPTPPSQSCGMRTVYLRWDSAGCSLRHTRVLLCVSRVLYCCPVQLGLLSAVSSGAVSGGADIASLVVQHPTGLFTSAVQDIEFDVKDGTSGGVGLGYGFTVCTCIPPGFVFVHRCVRLLACGCPARWVCPSMSDAYTRTAC